VDLEPARGNGGGRQQHDGDVERNIELARSFQPMTEAEKRDLYRHAPEYAGYACRRCPECLPNSLGLDLKRVFGLEGYFDRQMHTGYPGDPADCALREDLRFGCRSHDLATQLYGEMEPKIPKHFARRPYEADVPTYRRAAQASDRGLEVDV